MIERTLHEKTLIEACRNNFLKLIIDYKNCGINIHFDDDLLLRQAVMCGSLDIVQYLVEDGANIHFKDEEAFIFSVMKDHNSIFDYLLNLNVNFDVQDGQALLFAVKNNNSYIAKKLIKKGSKFLNDAFIFSITQKQQEMSDFLLTFKPDIHFNNDEAFLKAIECKNIYMVYHLLPFINELNDVKPLLNQESLIWFDNVLLNSHLKSSLSENLTNQPISKI